MIATFTSYRVQPDTHVFNGRNKSLRGEDVPKIRGLSSPPRRFSPPAYKAPLFQAFLAPFRPSLLGGEDSPKIRDPALSSLARPAHRG